MNAGEYMRTRLVTVTEFGDRVYNEIHTTDRNGNFQFPAVVFRKTSGVAADVFRRPALTAQDFDIEIQAASAAEAETLCGKAMQALRRGGRLLRVEAPRTIYDEELSKYREVASVRIRL